MVEMVPIMRASMFPSAYSMQTTISMEAQWYRELREFQIPDFQRF